MKTTTPYRVSLSPHPIRQVITPKMRIPFQHFYRSMTSNRHDFHVPQRSPFKQPGNRLMPQVMEVQVVNVRRLAGLFEKPFGMALRDLEHPALDTAVGDQFVDDSGAGT